MEKEFVVTFLNLDTNRVNCDCFMGKSESEANRGFKECYRNS